MSVIFCRTELKSRTQDITVALYLPCELLTNKLSPERAKECFPQLSGMPPGYSLIETNPTIHFSPDELKGRWPGCQSHWVNKTVWGTPVWDGEKLVIEWSDHDSTSVDLTPGMSIRVGRVLTFESRDHGKTTLEVVTTEIL